MLVENYDEQGNIVKTIVYRNSRPVRVRLYGTHKGDRAFRETRRGWKFPKDLKDKDDYIAVEPRPEQKLYTIKYKYNSGGNLLEMRVLRDDGKEMESAKYNLQSKTVKRRYDSSFQPRRSHYVVRGILESIMIANTPEEPVEIVSTLDAKGNSIEDAITYRTITYYQ